MARVTVEDCIVKVPNRFELVLLSAQRARAISSGAPITLDRDNDKNPVVALREIADNTVEIETLREHAINGLQRRVEVDEPEEDNSALRLAAREMAQGGMVTVKPAAPEGDGDLVDDEGMDSEGRPARR